MLLLAWKMGAQRMGYFTRGEFEGGARALKATDAKSMKKAALGLEDEVAAQAPLLAFATFAFKYCLTVRSCVFHTLPRGWRLLSFAARVHPPCMHVVQEAKAAGCLRWSCNTLCPMAKVLKLIVCVRL